MMAAKLCGWILSYVLVVGGMAVAEGGCQVVARAVKIYGSDNVPSHLVLLAVVMAIVGLAAAVAGTRYARSLTSR